MTALALDESRSVILESQPFDLTVLMADTRTLKFVDHEGSHREFHPDETKGYFQFESAFGFPEGESIYGTAFHPQTIANSYQSLIDQPLDYEHRKQVNNPALQHDHILGHIVAVNYPQTPSIEGWRLTDKPTPRITAVAAFSKQAMGMRRIVGEHMTGRHHWTVSYDVGWGGDEDGKHTTPEQMLANSSSFAVKIPPGEKPVMEHSTPDFLAQGYELIPGDKAPKDLIDSINTNGTVRAAKPWRGRKVTLLMNHRLGKVHFKGMALVRYGAEKAAGIKTMTASAGELAGPIMGIREVLGQFLVGRVVKPISAA